MPSAGVLADHRGQNADWPGAGHQHVLTQHGKGKCGVHGVAEGVEDRGNLRRDQLPVYPGVHCRKCDVVGERSIQMNADPPSVDAKMPATGPAIAASTTYQVALAADKVAHRDVGDSRPDLHDLTGEFMTYRQRRTHRLTSPGIPRLDVQIRPADTCGPHPDKHVKR